MKGLVMLGLSALAMHVGGARAITACDPSDPAFICGLDNAEDLVRLPGTPWVVASQLNLDLQSGRPPKSAGLGPLKAIKIDTREVHALYPSPSSTVDWDRKTYPHCPGPPQAPTSHGLNVRPLGGNRFQVYFTNHGDRQSVEVVDVAVQGGRLRASWRGCIPVGEELKLWPNSVAPLPGGGLVLSGYNMAIWQPGGKWRRLQTYEGTKTGEPGSANGVEVSRDGRSIFVAEPDASSVIRMTMDGSGTPAVLKLNFLPDNLRWGEDGYLYAAGPQHIAAGFPLKECFAAAVCDLGFAVARIDPKTLTATEIFRSGEHGFSGKFGASTVALQLGQQLWMGTVRGDRIAILPVKP